MFRRVLNWLSSNWLSMLLALLMALAVWIVATLEENPVQEEDLSTAVEINVVGLGPGLIITNDYPKTTRVRLRAQQDTWASLSNEDVSVTADLSGLGAGTHQVQLKSEIDNQQAARVSLMNPQAVRFVLEERDQREMPVQIHTQGQLPEGFQAGDLVQGQSVVTVEGPKSKVLLISEVRATVSIEDQRSNIEQTADLHALDKDGNEVEDVMITPDRVAVSIPITQRANYRDFPVIVQQMGQTPPGYYLSSMEVTPQFVTVKGDPAVINEMQPYINTDPIDLTGRTDDFIVELPLELPAGVTVSGSPTVKVLVTIGVQQGNRQILRVPITIIGLDEGLTAEISPDTVDLLLYGPLPILDSLNPLTDVRVTIDLSDLTVGVHQVEPKGDIDITGEEVTIQSIFPPAIEVQIKTDTTRP
jgi:YbbR domain-containing protein